MSEKLKIPVDALKEIAEMTARKESAVIRAKTPEKKEVSFDLAKEREKWQKWYENHGFKVEIPEINLSEEQIKEIETLIEKGYVDDLAVVANELTYQELEPKMTKGYIETYQGDNFKNDGGFPGLDQLEHPSKTFRLVFFKNVKELDQDPLLKQTLNKSPEQMETFLKELKKQGLNLEGLYLKDYLVKQRKFTEETESTKPIQDQARHLDATKWSWCLKSKFPSGRVVDAYWYPAYRRLYVYAISSSYAYAGSGSPLGRSFLIK